MKKWRTFAIPMVVAVMMTLSSPLSASAFDLGGAIGGITKNIPGLSGGKTAEPGISNGKTDETTGRAYVEQNGSRAPLPYVIAYAGTNLRVVSENGVEVIYGESHQVGASDESGVLHMDPPAGIYTFVFWKSGYTSQTVRMTVPGTVPDIVLHPGGNKNIDFRK